MAMSIHKTSKKSTTWPLMYWVQAEITTHEYNFEHIYFKILQNTIQKWPCGRIVCLITNMIQIKLYQYIELISKKLYGIK